MRKDVKIVDRQELAGDCHTQADQRTVLETLTKMRRDTPSPDMLKRMAELEELQKQLQSRVDVYMSAQDINDIPSVEFFKGL